jgi:CRISPR-associated exonuclease Cas4
MIFIFLLIIVILMLGLLLLWLAARAREETGLPAGEIISSDTGALEKVDRPLISRRYGLVGRPDYLVQVEEAGRKLIAPVEVKSRKAPSTPYAGHVLQLATYCLLVEDRFKARPPYGLLRYADATFKIPFTDDLRREVLRSADAIRHARTAPDIPRQHNNPARCRGCGYRDACGEAVET